MKRSLEDIATHFGTAKVPHGFMPIYEQFFSLLHDEQIKLLEIGVAEGASMKTWDEYFKKGTIYGVDKVVQFESDSCIIVEGDASKYLHSIAEIDFDIIIDDGSHIAHEQLASFNWLWNCVKPGGYYVIEDLFALYDPVWNPDNPRTIIDEIQERMKSILVGGDSIQEVHWFGRNDINGIVFLRKRSEEYRIQPLEEFNMEKK